MMRNTKRMLVGVVLALGLFLGLRAVLANGIVDNGTGLAGAWTVDWRTHSIHTGNHFTDMCSGQEHISANIRNAPDNQKTTDALGHKAYKTALVMVKTVPLGGTIKETAVNHGSAQSPAYAASVSKIKDWMAWPIMQSEGRITVTPSGVNKKTNSAHALAYYILVLAQNDFPGHNWSGDVALVSDFTEGGTMPVDENGDYVVSYDENGVLILDTPPYTALRLTSAFEHVSGGTITYRYTLENFTDADRDFSFPDIRTGNYPSGWSGTVSANDSTEITYTLSGQNIWMQCTQADTSLTDEPDTVNCQPIEVYVPANKTAFIGTTTIQSATHIPYTTVNSIVYQVSAQAEEAYLVRIRGDDVSIVDSVTATTLSPATNYTLTDSDAPSGTNDYYVMAGVRTNGRPSDTAEVVNP